jgi:hypothetical protein
MTISATNFPFIVKDSSGTVINFCGIIVYALENFDSTSYDASVFNYNIDPIVTVETTDTAKAGTINLRLLAWLN